jgi:hypothetical protein
LIGYWPLKGDARDHSGQEHHGINHGVNLATGEFDGRTSYIEVPDHPSLNPGTSPFSISAWVYTQQDVTDIIGDVLSKFDASRRKGFTFCIKSSSGGYSSEGTDKHVYFGIDNGTQADFEDCGRPNATSNYISNSMTVFDGHLYCGNTDAATEQEWCHVYRYGGGTRWDDCGRLGNLRTRGVGPMLVHNGSLYAGTWSYDWTRVNTDQLDFCRVYRYHGDHHWEDCGQPGPCRRLFGMASFRGTIYVLGDDHKCDEYQGGKDWKVCGEWSAYVHPMTVHDDRLYVGAFTAMVQNGRNQAAVFAYDGKLDQYRVPAGWR